MASFVSYDRIAKHIHTSSKELMYYIVVIFLNMDEVFVVEV